MPGFFDGLLNGIENPLFLGGIGMMSGGAEGMQRGMAAGHQFAAQKKKQQQQDTFLSQIQNMQGLSDQDRQILGSSPELATSYLSQYLNDKQERASPMWDLKRRQAEATLAQTQAQTNKYNREAAGGGELPSNVREWQFFQGMNPQQRQEYLTMKRADRFYNTGTEFVQPDPTNPGGPPRASIPINVAEKERQQKIGEGQGAAAAALPVVEVSADRLLAAIDRVAEDQNLSMVTGMVGGRIPKSFQTEDMAAVQADIDQIGGATFLQAYNDLRGGGPIAVAESQAAKEAYNTLQTQTMGTPKYKAALARYRSEVEKLRGVARQKAQPNAPSPSSTAAPAAQGNTAKRPTAVNPQTGQKIEFDGQQWIEVR